MTRPPVRSTSLAFCALLVATATAAHGATLPNALAGLELWLDAGDSGSLTLSGLDVEQWDDLSGNGHHATPAVATRPTLAAGAIGGLAAVRFSRTPMGVAGDLGIAADQERTTLAVIRYTTLDNNNELAGTGTSSMIDVGTYSQSQRLRLRDAGHDGDVYSGDDTLPTGADHLLAVRSLPTRTQAYANGMVLFDAAGKYQHFPIGSDYQVGGANNDGRSYLGDLAEIAVFNRALSDAELNDVGYHLQTKYGIAGTYTEPASLPRVEGLKLWLDANDATTVTLDGSEVTQWDDKSGQANHAVAGATKRPTYETGGLGGRSYLDFSRDQLTVSDLGIADGQERTLFLVMDYSTLTQNSEIFGTATGTMIDVGTYFAPSDPREERLRLRSPAGNLYSEEGSVPTGANLLTVVGLGAGEGTLAFRDGVQILSDPGDFFHYDLTGNVGVGGALFNGREYVGHISEVLLFDRVLTGREMNDVGFYLEQKYGLDTQYRYVPEPHSVGMLALGALVTGLFLARRRRRRA